MAAFWPIGTAQIIRIVSYPVRKKSRFWLFCMWSVKEMYHALLPKTDYRDKGRGLDRRLWNLMHKTRTPFQIIHFLFSHGLFSLGHSYYPKAWHRLNISVFKFLYFILFFQYFCRYANYYVQDNVLYRTLFKAYGIRFMILVYGQVKIIVACSVHHEVISFTENVLTPWPQTIFSLSPWSSLLYGLSF